MSDTEPERGFYVGGAVGPSSAPGFNIGQSSRGGNGRGPAESVSSVDTTSHNVTEELLRKQHDAIGLNYSADDFVVESSFSVLEQVPTDAEWISTCNRFFSTLNATSDAAKKKCLNRLILEFLMNSASDKRPLTISKRWPTGVDSSIQDCWIYPDEYSARAFLRHPQAQMIATGIMTSIDNRALAASIRVKNRYNEKVPLGIAYDFCYAATNPYAQNHASEVNEIRRIKTLGTSAIPAVASNKEGEGVVKSSNRVSKVSGEPWFESPY